MKLPFRIEVRCLTIIREIARNIAGNQTIFHKIEQDNCFIIKQTVNEIHFTARKSVVRQKNISLRAKLDDLRIYKQ